MKTVSMILCFMALTLALSNNWKAYALETGYSLNGNYSGSAIKESQKNQ